MSISLIRYAVALPSTLPKIALRTLSTCSLPEKPITSKEKTHQKMVSWLNELKKQELDLATDLEIYLYGIESRRMAAWLGTSLFIYNTVVVPPENISPIAGIFSASLMVASAFFLKFDLKSVASLRQKIADIQRIKQPLMQRVIAFEMQKRLIEEPDLSDTVLNN